MRIRILDATVARIETHGERLVRLRDVAVDVGVAEPSLYHYFPNRESLIVAAHARRIRTNLAVTIDPFLVAAKQSNTREEFMTAILGVFHHSFQPERVNVRATRAEIVGNAFSREDLRREVIAALDESLTGPIAALDYAKEQGWLRPDIDTSAFAMFIFSMISSLVFPELHGDDDILSNWRSLALEAITTIVRSEQPPTNP